MKSERRLFWPYETAAKTGTKASAQSTSRSRPGRAPSDGGPSGEIEESRAGEEGDEPRDPHRAADRGGEQHAIPPAPGGEAAAERGEERAHGFRLMNGGAGASQRVARWLTLPRARAHAVVVIVIFTAVYALGILRRHGFIDAFGH